MRLYKLFFSFTAIVFSLEPLPAVTLLFDYTNDTGDFFSVGSDARSRLEEAGTFFSTLLVDDLDAITPGGINTWSATFTNPTTGVADSVDDPTIAADSILIYVGARDLGGSTLGSAGPGGFSASGTAGWLATVDYRGETGEADTPATDFGPWGGSLAMDSDSTWDFSADGSTLDPGENHFYSVLLHEIGHVLGIGSAGSWDDQINGSNEFTGASSMAEYGGAVPLDPGGNHWIADTDPGTFGDQPITSDIWGTSTSQEVAMDPNITVGTAKFFTDLDVAALEDIGWQSIPEPTSAVLMLCGLGTLFCRRRRSR